MAARRRGPRGHLGLPDRPRLGPGDPHARRPRRPRPQRHLRGRVPLRRRRLRRRLLRDLPARGPRHGPAAAPAARDVLGGVRTRRHRSGDRAREPDRCLRRHQRPGLHHPRHELQRGRRGPRPDRSRHQRHLRPSLLHLRPGGPGGHDRHRLLLLPGRPALGGPRAALRRVQPRPRGRRHRDVDRHGIRRVHPAGRPRPRRPLQGLRRRRRRHRLVRGRRHARRRAPLRRPPQRARGARRAARFGRQPGRCLQRADRAQRPFPAARDPAGPGERGALDRRRGRRRGARHRHDPGRPDRGAGAARHLRPGPSRRPAAAARLDQVEHRARPGRLRRRRRHQDRHGAPPRPSAQVPAHRRAVDPRGLDRGRGAPAHRDRRLAGDRTSAPCRCVVLRYQRHQRAHHHRAGPGDRARHFGRGARARSRGRAVAGVGQVRGGPGRPTGADHLPRLRHRIRPGGRLLPGRRSHRVRAPGGASRGHGCGG
ncbi:hypothetical protein APS67_006745 [Streptomyces sp. AVP053U2]|nr:hypothetical protein APS67_006745 [Streptomyces sp. AVP053U2]